jgi:hypothetical protein
MRQGMFKSFNSALFDHLLSFAIVIISNQALKPPALKVWKQKMSDIAAAVGHVHCMKEISPNLGRTSSLMFPSVSLLLQPKTATENQCLACGQS